MSNTAAASSDAPTATSPPPAEPPTPAMIVADFEARLRGLSQAVDSTTGQMAEALDGLRSNGHLPGHGLVVALGRCHRELTRLRHDLLVEAARHGLKIRPSWKLAGVRELDEFLDALRERLGEAGGPAPSSTPAEAPTQPILKATPTSPGMPFVATAPVAEAIANAIPAASIDVEPGIASHAVDVSPGTLVEETPTAATEPVDEAIAPAPVESGRHDVVADPGEAVAYIDPGEEYDPDAVEEDLPPAEDPSRAAALDVLERAARLALRDGTPLAELTAYHELTDQLRRSIVDAAPGAEPRVVAELAGRTHPVAQLVNAVDGSDDLSDEQWADLHSVVSETFGRPLAVALARHRLVLTPPPGA